MKVSINKRITPVGEKVLQNVVKRIINTALATPLCIVFTVALANTSIPDDMAVIAFDGDAWHVYVGVDSSLKKVDQIPNPRSFSFHSKSQKIAYIGSDNHLYLFDTETGEKTKLSNSDDDLRYAQPFFSLSGEALYIVQLPGGKSRRTEIVSISMSDLNKRYIVRKRTAQFEPYTRDNEHLYYSTAICVDDCEGMIWELWRREASTARQYQLTLLNHVSNQPHLSADNWLYFSSNAPDGYFHIWRMRPEVGATPEQLTFEKARDSEPFTDANNNVYFIRKTRASTKLMLLQSGDAVPLATNSELIDFRNLEVRQ